MSYQVLARKWRPSTFEEMVGQAHVLKALVNALDQQRLHHAYLFTGTRGVGKTTIARLLAKSLNCETGVSSKPCGVCSACTEIAEGRFVDLIEVDAASRTKVEDTRELLENVQYAPTRGRYKVYLIDEVHMLSTSSFNALLKTLEEPPPHVKFLLATTDPQKLPVTVLSRCLQFNLKNMSREHIVQHLSHILDVEQVPFDEPSLWAIAEGAQGSMRDALSLTDQAIAFGQGSLKEQEVATMLGTVDLKRVLKLTQALFEKNVDQIMALVAEVDEHSPDYMTLMTELMSTLHRVAIAQAAPNAIDNSKGDKSAIVALAKVTYAEDVHLFYQIAGKAKPDMALAPSERAGFEMALLRMLAFSQTPAASIGELPELTSASVALEGESVPNPKPEKTQPENQPVPVEPVVEAVESNEEIQPVSEKPVLEPAPEQIVSSEVHSEFTESQVQKRTTEEADTSLAHHFEETFEPQSVGEQAAAQSSTHVPDSAESVAGIPAVPVETDASTDPDALMADTLEEGSSDVPTSAEWPEVDLDHDPKFWWQVTLHRLGLAGMTKTLYAHSEWVGFDGETLKLTISQNYRKIMNDSHLAHFLKAIPKWLPNCTKLSYEFGPAEQTPQMWVDHLVKVANQQAFQYLKEDPFIKSLTSDYQGELEQESAVLNHNPIPSGD